jgi:hypothetical protein
MAMDIYLIQIGDTNMKETKKGNKAIRILGGNVFYGQYYDGEFQVLDSCSYTERKYQNMCKKYGF